MTTVLVGLLGTLSDCYYPGNDGNTKLLIHGTESVVGGDFTDTTGVHTVSFNGTQSDFSSVNNKSGFEKNIYFDGAGDYLTVPDSADWDFGVDDFTIDLWFNRSGSGSGEWLFCQCDSSANDNSWGTSARLKTDNTLEFRTVKNDGVTIYTVTSTTTFTSPGWNHLAVVRDGNTIELFINGTSEDTVSVTGITLQNSGELFTIGRYGTRDLQYYTGYIDEFRISKGVARWVSNFTPPVHPYCNNK